MNEPKQTRVFSGQKYFSPNIGNFEISNLATSIWVREWGNVASGRAMVRVVPHWARAGDVKFYQLRLG